MSGDHCGAGVTTVDREQFTVRVPKELLDRVREEAAAYGDSMNDLVISALEKEVRMREQLRLLNEIERRRSLMAKRGLQPDSTPVIRELRLRSNRND